MSTHNNIVAIIQARTGATRLPDKVLLKLEDKTVLEHVVERARKSAMVNEVIVATTTEKDDLRIVKLCSTKGIRVYCGSENDVLDRYYQTAMLVGADHIVRITADCPVIDPKVVDRVIALHLKKKADFTANIITETFPDGQDVEVFTFKALETAWERARLSSEREHVTPYIKKHPEIFTLVNLECEENLYHKRWTLDNPEDYVFLKKVYSNLYRKNRVFGMNDILRLLKSHPEIERINSNITRNEGYKKSLKEDLTVDITQVVRR